MLTLAFMHCPYLVCILFGMPSLHLFTFLMFLSLDPFLRGLAQSHTFIFSIFLPNIQLFRIVRLLSMVNAQFGQQGSMRLIASMRLIVSMRLIAMCA